MIVGLNALFLRPGKSGGTETYAAGLMRGLLEYAAISRLRVYVGPQAAEWPLPSDGRVERVVCASAGPGVVRRYLYEQLVLPRRARREGVDVLHSLAYTGPLRPIVPSVVSVHDLNFRALGHLMSPVRRTALRFVVGGAMRASHRILVLSQASQRQIVSAYPWAESRVRVIYIAPRPRLGAQTADVEPPLARPYLVAFSSQSPHKNMARLLEAWELLIAEGVRTHDLVLVGHSPRGADTIRLPPSVRRTGFVDDATVVQMLRAADALVFPSLYEGFGLPVLEAMSLGVPVASSNAASLPEVGGAAALYFDPHSVTEMADAMRRLTSDAGLRARMRAAGLEQAATFSWSRAAKETIAAYSDALAGSLP